MLQPVKTVDGPGILTLMTAPRALTKWTVGEMANIARGWPMPLEPIGIDHHPGRGGKPAIKTPIVRDGAAGVLSRFQSDHPSEARIRVNA